MRPQTAIALIVGALLGVVGTWLAIRQISAGPSTTESLSQAPHKRIRPESTRVQTSISGATSSRRITDENENLAGGTKNEGEHSPLREDSISLRENSTRSGANSESGSTDVIHSIVQQDQVIEPGEDDSYSKYRRFENLVIRVDYSANNVRLQSITYQIGPSGRLLGYEVLDGDRNKLYRATLGYSKRKGPTDGKLVVERIFDVQDLNYTLEPDKYGERKEMPTYQFIFSYDDDGTPQEPVGVNLLRSPKGDSLVEFGDVLHMMVSHGRIAPHIVKALNQSYPIEPLIQP